MLNELLDPYKEQIENSLSESIDTFGPKNRLRNAIEYALKNGGKRFRPAIVCAVADAVGKNRDVMDVALAVEFFHTASLIADDLPCMDNDDIRRKKPSLHKAFDEATAILATYALISAGYERIRLNALKQGKPALGMLALESATKNTGIFGATGGQYFDLFPEAIDEENILDILDKKTGTLFEISFVFGWIFGGGAESELQDVKDAARHFGRAFQISDDFLDFNQDDGAINYPSLIGVDKALKRVSFELEELKKTLKKLRLESPELLALVQMIEKRIYTPASSLS